MDFFDSGNGYGVKLPRGQPRPPTGAFPGLANSLAHRRVIAYHSLGADEPSDSRAAVQMYDSASDDLVCR